MRELLDALERPVELLVAHGPEETPLPGARDIDFGAETQRVVERARRALGRVTVPRRGRAAGLRALSRRSPCCPEGEDVGLRYYGLPWGYELGSLIGAVLEAGKRESSLSAGVARAPRGARPRPRDRRLRHADLTALPAGRAAGVPRRRSPRRASAPPAIEATEFPALADSMDVWAVPRIVVNGVPQWDGAVPERVFLDRVLAPAFE